MQDSINVAVIEQPASDKKSKKTYLLDEGIASQLSKSDYKIKQLYVVYTVDGLVRFVILDVDSTNSWPRSCLDLLTVAKKHVISANRDYEAKVYGYSIEDSIAPFGITDEQVDASLCETFAGEYHITNVDHPMVRDLAKKDSGSVVLVAEIKSDEIQSQPGDIVTENAKTETFLVEPELVKATSVDDDDFDLMAALEIKSDDSMSLDTDMDMNMDLDDGLSLDDLKM